MTVSASAIEREFLHPALDARAVNVAEARLLCNLDTPEVDSLAELAMELRHDGVLELTRAALTLNGREGEVERLLCGAADALVTDLRFIERNSKGMRSELTAKGIIRKLWKPLDVIADPPADALAFADAVREVDAVIADVPRVQLLGPTVERKLGPTRFALLGRLIERRTA